VSGWIVILVAAVAAVAAVSFVAVRGNRARATLAAAGFQAVDAAQQGVGVGLEGGEIDVVALANGGFEAFDAQLDLGYGDFFAAALFGGFGVGLAGPGKRGIGFVDGGHQLVATTGPRFDFGFEVVGLGAVGFDFALERLGLLGGAGDAASERLDFGLAAVGNIAQLGEPRLHRLLLLLVSFAGPAFDGQGGAHFVE
jgi:hypothetical protein